MSRFIFSIADDSDDAALRARMAKDIMSGPMQVSFRREPNYFTACEVFGKEYDVITCRLAEDNTIIGIGMRAIFEAYINGKAQPHGYLSDLRGDAAYRKGTLLARGYRYLSELHHQNPVPLYDTLILGGNETARQILGRPRQSLPCYRDMGRIISPLLLLGFDRPPLKIDGLRLERGTWQRLPEIMDFHKRHAPQKQFAPVFTPEDFKNNRLRDLHPEDIFLAMRGDNIIAMAAVWDQQNFRQTHIESYSQGLKIIKPFYNLLSHITPLNPLPPIGTAVPYAYLSLVTIANNDKKIFAWLLRQIYRACRQKDWHYLLPCLHESDPLTSIVKSYKHIKAGGHLYIVHYKENEADFKKLDNRISHIELAIK